MIQSDGGYRNNRNTFFSDQKRILIGAMRGAAVLDDTQAPGGKLVDGAVIEQDHAIGDVFLETMPGQRASPRSPVMTEVTPRCFNQSNSRRSSARRTAVFEKPPKRRFEGVQHHALRADRIDGEPQSDEQPSEVEVARFLDLAAHDRHVIDQDFLRFGKRL
jgi:hypothetical protein